MHDVAVLNFSFPRAARLIKTDEFSSVFVFRPKRGPDPASETAVAPSRKPLRSAHFVVYYRDNAGVHSVGGARLGLVIGKKMASRAVERNLIKRTLRELFRHCRSSLGDVDIVIRLQARFDRDRVKSREAIVGACVDELRPLFARLSRIAKPGIDGGAGGA